jgi:hypothetical protein
MNKSHLYSSFAESGKANHKERKQPWEVNPWLPLWSSFGHFCLP